MELVDLQCGIPRMEEALSQDEVYQFQNQVPNWVVISRDNVLTLQRVYKFKDFAQALAFTNLVGALAEKENHHPLIQTEWGRVTVIFWTHHVNGLHLNDFIAAAKAEQIYLTEKPQR